jgi:hypothetical protein
LGVLFIALAGKCPELAGSYKVEIAAAEAHDSRWRIFIEENAV